MKEYTEVEKAILATAIDGEGSIAVGKHKQSSGHYFTRYTPMVRLYNTNRKLLEFWSETANIGTIERRPQRRPNAKDLWAWRVRTNEIPNFLRQIYPYLVAKREQADLMFEYFSYCHRPYGGWLWPGGKRNEPRVPIAVSEQRENIWLAMKKLNKFGVLGDYGIPLY